MRRASYHPDLMRQPASDEYSMLDTLGITSIRQMLESLIDRTHDFDPFGKIHVLFFGVAWRYPNILHGCLQFHNACTHGCLLSRISNSHRVCRLVTLSHLLLITDAGTSRRSFNWDRLLSRTPASSYFVAGTIYQIALGARNL